MQSMDFGHVPIMARECLEYLDPQPGETFVDGTLGGAGHAALVLSRLQGGRLVGIDLDDDALAASAKALAQYGQAFMPVKGNYKDVRRILSDRGISAVDGALLDLGVSSWQLNQTQRGFSYSQDAPLDMRMDQTQSLTAREVVNTYAHGDLARIIRLYGEDNFAGRIAAFIVRERERNPIDTTVQLADIILQAIPARYRRTGGHPAKRTFQAIRIEVNGELEGLEQAAQDFIDMLAPGARLCVITFHSLEDRAVKQAMKRAEHPCTCPPDAPMCVCGRIPEGKMLTRKPLTGSPEELQSNPRAHSAKLRVFEKKA